MKSDAAEFDKLEGWVTMPGPKGSVILGWQRSSGEYHPKDFSLDKNASEYHVWGSIDDIPARRKVAKTQRDICSGSAPDASYDNTTHHGRPQPFP
jgi:hypothetical protein